MIKSLEQMENIDLNAGNWLKYLYCTNEKNCNLNHIKSLSDISSKNVFNYVKKTLKILNDSIKLYNLSNFELFIIEETLKWADVAKCGYKYQRQEWDKKGYNLAIHNIGSSQLYMEEMGINYNKIVAILIKTHGLIGQHIMGEVNLDMNREVYQLIENNLIDSKTLRKILIVLNRCIILAVSNKLYEHIKEEVEHVIDRIIVNDFSCNYDDFDYVINRFKKLLPNISDEDTNQLKIIFKEQRIYAMIVDIFKNQELWYFDAALNDFKANEIIKILLIIRQTFPKVIHVSFEELMREIYIDYNGNKEINIYKKRIMEAYLDAISYDEILNNNLKNNPHIKAELKLKNTVGLFNFNFSIQARKLIEFCEVAYDSSDLYSKAVFMLYDLFGFRRDKYDRFYNEINYLNTMNLSMKFKAVILDYIVGNTVLDVGPGGGGLLNLIEEKQPNLNVIGIDISQNVIDELNKKKSLEKRHWKVVKGDALNLKNYFKEKDIDTIIFSSIIHELFSYIETDGKKFNHMTIKKALLSAYDVLPSGGRIIIRDGIMTEPVNQYRIIEFNNPDDIKILERYCHDFQGRKIKYEPISNNKVKMLVNDAMEFLYTYTWGENSYPLEVQEQFGYFTLSQYVNFINEIFDNKCKIIECYHFLQDGYAENLLTKISIYDENHNIVDLPDSTCIIVIEK